MFVWFECVPFRDFCMKVCWTKLHGNLSGRTIEYLMYKTVLQYIFGWVCSYMYPDCFQQWSNTEYTQGHVPAITSGTESESEEVSEYDFKHYLILIHICAWVFFVFFLIKNGGCLMVCLTARSIVFIRINSQQYSFSLCTFAYAREQLREKQWISPPVSVGIQHYSP